MSHPLSIQNRKILVIVNYICLPSILLLFYLGKYHGWSYLVFIGLAVFLTVSVATFRMLHLKTKLWHQFHSKDAAGKLDERQFKRTLEAIKMSYNIFSVTSLMVIFAIAWMAEQYDPMLMLVYVSLVYFAHTLPSSMLAWIEKEI